MNKFLVALAFTAAVLALNTEPAAAPVHPGNFNPAAALDTTQVTSPAPYTDNDWVCFRSAQYPEFDCVPAKSAPKEIFSDPRLDIEIVTLDKKGK
jgi:hypothetical protein